MKNKILKITFFILMLLSAAAHPTFAQTNKIDIDALTDETQKMSKASDEMTLIWWIPEEFWRASLEQDKAITASQTEALLKVIRPYTVIVVVDGKMGTIGGVTYKSESQIKNNIQIIDIFANAHRPLSEENINADAKNLMALLKPFLVNLLGPMGQNMHFVVFPSKNSKGQEVVNVRKEGVFSVKLDTREFKWRLPLSSVIPPKICPTDNEKLNGGWKFCPWHGTELKAN